MIKSVKEVKEAIQKKQDLEVELLLQKQINDELNLRKWIVENLDKEVNTSLESIGKEIDSIINENRLFLTYHIMYDISPRGDAIRKSLVTKLKELGYVVKQETQYYPISNKMQGDIYYVLTISW